MQIILQEDVEKLGNRGEIVEVAPGYARNYLLPKKLAMEATPGNLKRLERMRATFAKREADDRASAQTLSDLLANVSLTLTRKAGENDQLFGSVTTADISAALEAQGYKIDKRKIQLTDPIKLIGEYQVAIKLHRDIVANVKLAVTREGNAVAVVFGFGCPILPGFWEGSGLMIQPGELTTSGRSLNSHSKRDSPRTATSRSASSPKYPSNDS